MDANNGSNGDDSDDNPLQAAMSGAFSGPLRQPLPGHSETHVDPIQSDVAGAVSHGSSQRHAVFEAAARNASTHQDPTHASLPDAITSAPSRFNSSTDERSQPDLLQSALADAFSPTPLPRQAAPGPAGPSSAQAEVPAPEVADAGGAPSASAQEDAWKEEYESHVKTWQAESAQAREKAERTRAEWEARRAAERKESQSGWETVGKGGSSGEHPTGIPKRTSPSPADARDLTAGETPRTSAKSTPVTTSSQPTAVSQASTHDRHDTGEDSRHSGSQKWEDIASEMTSSFPSMSFPERPSETPSPSHRDRSAAAQKDESPPGAPAPLSATLSVFDTSLSTRTRVYALVSAVGINVLLPFVNGVMLGFGEIFAKNVLVGWLGWKIPSSTPRAAGVGIGVESPEAADRKRR